jgi:hypothetical protein
MRFAVGSEEQTMIAVEGEQSCHQCLAAAEAVAACVGEQGSEAASEP